MANCIKQGFDIPPDPEVRTFIAEQMAGKAKHSASRISSRKLEVAALVFWRRQKGDRTPIETAAKFFGRNPGEIHRSVKAWPDEKALQWVVDANQAKWIKVSQNKG